MDDLEFVRRCATGDKQSWDRFVDTYSRLVYNYIHAVLRVKGFDRTQDAAAEIFQEVFLSLVKDNFRKLKSFKAKNGCSLASWLRQVVINLTIDHTRRYRPLVSLEEEEDDTPARKDSLPDAGSSVAEMLQEEERVIHLKDCIASLATDDKYFLELHVNRGMKLEELTGAFGVSRGAIDMRKTRIVERLRECFKRKGFEFKI